MTSNKAVNHNDNRSFSRVDMGPGIGAGIFVCGCVSAEGMRAKERGVLFCVNNVNSIAVCGEREKWKK